MKKVDLIIRNGIILTINPSGQIINKGSIAIEKNIIIAIDSIENIDIEYFSDEIIDADEKIVMPGLINCHTHLPMSLYRGIADDMQLKEWLYDYIFPAEAEFSTANNISIATQLAVLEMIKSGTTCFNDMYYFEDEIAQAATKIGIRGVISESLIDYPAPNAKNYKEAYKYTEMLIEKYHNDVLIKVAVAAHAPYSCSVELLKEARKLSEKHNLNFNIHVAESKWEIKTIKKLYNLTPVQHLENIGILGEGFVFAHGVWLNNDDIEIVAKHNIAIAHCPECNMKLSSGVAPISKLLENNCNVGLGTDGVASNNNLNMFEEMKAMTLLAKLSSNDSSTINAQKSVQIATIDAAKCLRMDNLIGSLEVGKLADIIIIDNKKPNNVPQYNIYSSLVYSISGSDVTDVIINGKIILKNNSFLNINEDIIFNNINKIAQKIKKKIIKS